MFTQNAVNHIRFLLVDNSAGQPVTGVPVSVSRFVNTAQSAVNGSVISAGGGVYILSATSADSNVDTAAYLLVASTSDPATVPVLREISFQTPALTTADVQNAVASALSDFNAASAGDIPDVSAITNTALANYGVPTSAGMESRFAAVSAAIPTLAEISAELDTAFDNYNVASAGDVSGGGGGTETIVVSVSVASADASSVTLASGITATSGLLTGALLYIRSGTGAQQTRIITDQVGSRLFIGPRNWITTPGTDAIAQVRPAYDDVVNILATADTSAIVNNALDNYNVASAGEVTGGGGLTGASASAIFNNALTNYNVASSNELLTSAGVSAIQQTVLSNYNVASAGDITATVETLIATVSVVSADNSSLTVASASGFAATSGYITGARVFVYSGTGLGQTRVIADQSGTRLMVGPNNWQVNPDNTSVVRLFPRNDSLVEILNSAETSALIETALTNHNVAIGGASGTGLTEAQTSAVMQNALQNYNVASAGDVSGGGGGGLTGASASAIFNQALANYDVPTSADIETIVAAQTSTDTSGIVAGAIANATPLSANVVQVNGVNSQKLADSIAAVINGSANAGTLSNTQMTTSLSAAVATDDKLIGRTLIWVTGNLIYEAVQITDYNASNGLVTYTTATLAPSAGDRFIVT